MKLLVSGWGILAQNLHRRRLKKLDDDLVRVRELQQQLGVLRAIREKKKNSSSEKSATKTINDKVNSTPKKETKGK